MAIEISLGRQSGELQPIDWRSRVNTCARVVRVTVAPARVGVFGDIFEAGSTGVCLECRCCLEVIDPLLDAGPAWRVCDGRATLGHQLRKSCPYFLEC